MLKVGKYRAVRNVPVGWVLQAIHSTDVSERRFRLLMELLLFAIAFGVSGVVAGDVQWPLRGLVAFFVSHTISWFLSGNFWVYMLDSFLWVKNPGLDKVIDFAARTGRLFEDCDCADAVLIYGSMCRSQFHGRSDLDIRVVRRRDSVKGLIALPLGYYLRARSFFQMNPVDLEVVDSLDFVRKQMRDDEKPIVVYLRDGVHLPEKGKEFSAVERNPATVLRSA